MVSSRYYLEVNMDFVAMHFEKSGSSAKLALVKFKNGRRLWKKIKITYYTGHTYHRYALIHETNELLEKVSSFVGDRPVFCCNAEVKRKKFTIPFATRSSGMIHISNYVSIYTTSRVLQKSWFQI